METYVALLRGINVGGKNKIDMQTLRQIFTDAGFKNVKSYINSGNVIFDADIDPASITSLIEEAIEAKTKLRIKTVIRTKQQIKETAENFPDFFGTNNWKDNIIFLGEDIDKAEILDKYNIHQEMEKNSYFSGVLYWSADLAVGTRAVMYKLSQQPEYQEMTVRSPGTVKKIYELMKI